MCIVAQPDWQRLAYLVFDGQRLVAAFALRDDAEDWIEQCGNQQMMVRESSPSSQSRRAKSRRTDKVAATPVSRKR
jgi:hypothetical protein